MRGCLRCFVSLFVATTDKLMASALLWSLQITVTLWVLGDGDAKSNTNISQYVYV